MQEYFFYLFRGLGNDWKCFLCLLNLQATGLPSLTPVGPLSESLLSSRSTIEGTSKEERLKMEREMNFSMLFMHEVRSSFVKLFHDGYHFSTVQHFYVEKIINGGWKRLLLFRRKISQHWNIFRTHAPINKLLLSSLLWSFVWALDALHTSLVTWKFLVWSTWFVNRLIVRWWHDHRPMWLRQSSANQ